MAPRTFTVATTVQDPLTADRLVEVLTKAKLDAFHRACGAASSDGLAAASPGFWEVLVKSESMGEAEQLINAELSAIEADGDENAKAAEEEAMSGENPVAE